MRAIINGLRYDTENATNLGGDWHGYSGDFHHWSADLYRTPRSGRYFLAGKGGPLTQFSHAGAQQNERVGGSRIIPMSAEDARAWAEHHLTVEEVEAAFAEAIEDA